MTAEERQVLEDGGVNVDEAMQRFMNNEKLMERFLKKFETDPSYANLVKAIEEKDCDKAFAESHTLKGISGNLALGVIQKLVSEQTDHFRGKDFEAGAAMMPQVTQAYENALGAIKEVYGT